VVVVTFLLESDGCPDAMTDDNKYRTDILDSRMDSIGSGGRRTEEPVDPLATLRQYPLLNLFVTPGRVCDTFGEELRSSLTSRPKCCPVEASAVVVARHDKTVLSVSCLAWRCELA